MKSPQESTKKAKTGHQIAGEEPPVYSGRAETRKQASSRAAPAEKGSVGRGFFSTWRMSATDQQSAMTMGVELTNTL